MSSAEELRELLRAERQRSADAREETMLIQHELERVREASATSAPNTDSLPRFVVAQTRRLERLGGRAERPSDPDVGEWVEDMRCHLAGNPISEDAACALVVGHLRGKARLEISGRGLRKTEDIFVAILAAFGGSNDIATLQERLFQYRQLPGESVIDCSLKLVDLFNKIADKDVAYASRRDQTLKERLTAAVSDQSLAREMRRLMNEASSLTFFEMRDRAIEWAGGDTIVTASHHETTAIPEGVAVILRRQEEILQNQKRQIEELTAAMKSSQVQQNQPRRRPLQCWACGELGHVRRECRNSQPRQNGPADFN